jgi:hypothetical protein
MIATAVQTLRIHQGHSFFVIHVAFHNATKGLLLMISSVLFAVTASAARFELVNRYAGLSIMFCKHVDLYHV